MITAKSDQALPRSFIPPPPAPQISLEQYYSEAGPDYAAWSSAFNMHFGYWGGSMNPLNREAMLEQMNKEVLARLTLAGRTAPQILDLGCGLGATLRSFAQCLSDARLIGITKVPWQVEHARVLNEASGCAQRVCILEGDYEDSHLRSSSFDGVYALESSCHARGVDKKLLLQEASRLLKPGGRLVIADGFLAKPFMSKIQRRIYRRMCECWVIDELADLRLFTAQLKQVGFREIMVEHLQMRVAPSVAHIPWVTLKFLLTDVVFGKRKMTRARWNNVLAPILLPLVGAPLGPMGYCMITATRA